MTHKGVVRQKLEPIGADESGSVAFRGVARQGEGDKVDGVGWRVGA